VVYLPYNTTSKNIVFLSKTNKLEKKNIEILNVRTDESRGYLQTAYYGCQHCFWLKLVKEY